MEEPLAIQLPVLVRRADRVLRRDARSSTHAAFSPRLGRFVAAKVGGGVPVAGGGSSDPVRQIVARMRREPVAGVAPLVDVGAVGGRGVQVMELLPGRPLSRLLPEDVEEISGWIASEAWRIGSGLIADRSVWPVWGADTVHLWRDAAGGLRLGLADYEFGPGRCRSREEREARAVAEFVSWASGLGGAAGTAFSGGGWETFSDVEEALARCGPDPVDADRFAVPLDAEPWPWLPGPERLPDWYGYGVRREGVFEAEDRVRGGRVRVHLLPPREATGDVWDSCFRQAAVLARGERIEGFRAVRAVLQDPSCRLVVEPAGGTTLESYLERLPDRADKVRIGLLRAVSETVDRLQRAGWTVPAQRAADILVREDRGPGGFEVEFRAVPSTWLHAVCPAGAGWGRWRNPGAWFLALAAEVFASREVEGGLRPEIERALVGAERIVRGEGPVARAWCLARLEAACGLGPVVPRARFRTGAPDLLGQGGGLMRRAWTVGAGAVSVLAVIGLAWFHRAREESTGVDGPEPSAVAPGVVLADTAR
jgi:hypothetical protein